MYIDGLFSFIQYVFGLDLLLRPQRRTEIGAIKTGDIGDGDLLGAFRLAGGDVGAAAEALVVHLLDHVQDTFDGHIRLLVDNLINFYELGRKNYHALRSPLSAAQKRRFMHLGNHVDNLHVD